MEIYIASKIVNVDFKKFEELLDILPIGYNDDLWRTLLKTPKSKYLWDKVLKKGIVPSNPKNLIAHLMCCCDIDKVEPIQFIIDKYEIPFDNIVEFMLDAAKETDVKIFNIFFDLFKKHKTQNKKHDEMFAHAFCFSARNGAIEIFNMMTQYIETTFQHIETTFVDDSFKMNNYIDSFKMYNSTALAFAAQNDRIEIVKILICKYGSDPKYINVDSKRNILSYATGVSFEYLLKIYNNDIEQRHKENIIRLKEQHSLEIAKLKQFYDEELKKIVADKLCSLIFLNSK